MSTPTFNASSANGLTALQFVNDGMSDKLSSTGNTIRVNVGSLQTRMVESSPPGSNWTTKRTLGRQTRRVVWHVQLKCDSDSDLNDVEATIEAYLADGGSYALTDGKGRSTTRAVMVTADTRREGFRERCGANSVRQRWVIAFDVLEPKVGSSVL